MAEGAPTSNEAPGFFVFLAFVFTLLGTDGTWKGKNCQKNQWWEMWETTWKEMKEQTKGRKNQRTKGKTGKKAFRRFVSLFNLILPSRLGFFTHTHTRTKQTCVLLFSIESTLLPSSYCSFSPVCALSALVDFGSFLFHRVFFVFSRFMRGRLQLSRLFLSQLVVTFLFSKCWCCVVVGSLANKGTKNVKTTRRRRRRGCIQRQGWGVFDGAGTQTMVMATV